MSPSRGDERIQGGFPAPKTLPERIRQNERGSGVDPYTEWDVVGPAGNDDAESEFENGWHNLGDPFPPLAYHVSEDGKVFIRGGISGGAPGSRIFILPPGYRPEYTERFIIPSGTNLFGIIQVDPTGDVTFLG